MDAVRLADDIHDAAALLDRPRVAELCAALVDLVRDPAASVPPGAVQTVLHSLRRERYFEFMEQVGAALIAAGRDTPGVRRLYAQALIDQKGRVDEAVRFLEQLARDTPAGSEENVEARGLLGRAFKQRYVHGGSPDDLRQALAHYHGVFRDADARTFAWHRINAVALRARAERDRVAVDSGYPEVEPLAAELLEWMVDKGAAMDAWDMATGLEACVALRRAEEATAWAHGYAAHPGADSFEIGSTLRQLEEVWQLTATAPMGAAVLPHLRDGLLRRQNGFFEVSPQEVAQAAESLEKVLGFDYFMTVSWYRNGLARARCVARIGLDTDRGLGTGFLMRGRDLHAPWGDGLVLVTNAHVVSPAPLPEVNALDPAEAVVHFEALENAETYRVREVLWTSPPAELDCTVLALDRVVACAEPLVPYEVAPRLPAKDGRQRVYIIGHPAGGSLSFSIHDNLLLDYDDRRVHYRTPTEGGSSGSPVFNAQWRLIGLHHAGFEEVPRLNGQPGTYAANEGIPLAAIRSAIAANPAQGQRTVAG